MAGRYDAVLFDAGGVLLFPDPSVLIPALAVYGASNDPGTYFRAHYSAMAAKSRSGAGEREWGVFNAAFVAAVGVPAHEQAEAAYVLSKTRNAHLWRAPIRGSREGLALLNQLGVPVGVVSNAEGQIESVLARMGMCQVGPGAHPEVLCVVDSQVVGTAKPDPHIFDHALVHLPGVVRERILYVGDSVTMDVGGARAAGLTPVLFDPFGDTIDLYDGLRVASVVDVAGLLAG